MKKTYLFLSTCILIFLTLSSSLCPNSEDCKDSEIPTIFVEFTLFVQVKYNDGVLSDEKIVATIWKKTCDGDMRNYDSEKGYLNTAGYFTVGTRMMSMNNKKDKIHYRFTAYHTPFYPADEQKEEIVGSFDYAQVIAQKNDDDELKKTFYIEIPTDSDGHYDQ